MSITGDYALLDTHRRSGYASVVLALFVSLLVGVIPLSAWSQIDGIELWQGKANRSGLQFHFSNLVRGCPPHATSKCSDSKGEQEFNESIPSQAEYKAWRIMCGIIAWVIAICAFYCLLSGRFSLAFALLVAILIVVHYSRVLIWAPLFYPSVAASFVVLESPSESIQSPGQNSTDGAKSAWLSA